MVEQAALKACLGFNINFTTNGVHGNSSRHYTGQAVDINFVDGRHVGDNNATLRLQMAFQQLDSIRENFGPYWNIKTLDDGSVVDKSVVAPDHLTHIHVSVQ